MATTAVPAKRARVESESQTNQPQTAGATTRHEEFWFQDGSVVLRVQATLFRVHKSFLASHSEIFADLFTVPQPDSPELVDGCPVVCLHDSPDDFVHFLKALYDPCYFDSFIVADGDIIPIPLYGILRLATKYCVPKIRRKGLCILRKPFAVTLDEFDASWTPQWRSVSFSNLIKVVNLAREIQVLDIFPYTLYRFGYFSVETLLCTAPAYFSLQDKVVCLTGREKLVEMQRSHTLSFAFDFVASPRCLQMGICRCTQQSPHVWALHRGGSFTKPYALRQFKLAEKNILKVCSECTIDAEIRHVDGRKHVWNALPAIFELGSWEELLRARDNEM